MTNHHRGRAPLLATLLAGILLSGPGCVSAPLTPTEKEKSAGPVPQASVPRPVTADQVDAQNARSQLQAVRAELAQEP